MRWTSLAILASLILHLLIYWLFSGPKWKPTPSPEPIAIEVHDSAPEGNPESTTQTPGKKNARARRGSKGRGLTLKQLSPQFDFNGAIAAGKRSRFEDARGSSEWQPEHWGVRGGSLAEIEHFVSFDKLLREIQGLLYYPGALGYNKFSGNISARLYFTKESKCDKKRTWARGHHYYLRFYVMALLQKLCQFETVEHMGFKEGQFVDLIFAFILIDADEDRLDNEKRDQILGNVFRFERTYRTTAFYEWKLGPFRGIWGVPAVSLDFPWVLYNWEKWVEGRDPLDAFREK